MKGSEKMDNESKTNMKEIDSSNSFNGPTQRVYNSDPMTELGRVGQKKFGGIFFEEFIPELRGKRGVETYKEMAENDDIIGAMMFAVENLIRQSTFDIEPQGTKEIDIECADFVKSCLDDMCDTWTDTLSEILSFLVYGWSWHEIVYKRRCGKQEKKADSSKFNDGLIGWKKLAIRSQDTLYRWVYDDEDELIGMEQIAPPDYQVRFIPADKSLHFITKSRKSNPEGRSILRNAYRDYYFKRRFQEIEGIGIERDLAGLPTITPPDDFEIWDDTNTEAQKAMAYAEMLVQNIRRDAKEGLVIPPGWKLELLSSGSKRQFEVGTVIDRYDKRMAMTAMADFILLGHQGTGSFALSDNKTELFSVALGTYMDIIVEVFNNQAIPRLIDLNHDHFAGITDYPVMKHGDVEDTDVEKLGNYLQKMIGIGVITPDRNLEQFARSAGNLPEMLEEDYPEDIFTEDYKEDKNIDSNQTTIKEVDDNDHTEK